MNLRTANEVEHGKRLAAADTERVWGWATPAGLIRARRRAHLISTSGRLGPGVSVLEIGCGTGMFTEMFAATGAVITAVDISEELLQKARARRLPDERVCFVRTRFENFVAAQSFDSIVGSSVLHHLDLSETLSAMYRLLKPNGRISFAEPNMLNPQVWATLRFRRLFPGISPDETAFVRWKLARALHRAGFREIKIVPFDWLHPALPTRLIKMMLPIGGVLEHIPIVREYSGSLHIEAVRPGE